jgi:hypothetical protein
MDSIKNGRAYTRPKKGMVGEPDYFRVHFEGLS